MNWNKNERIPKEEIQDKVTNVTVQFGHAFQVGDEGIVPTIVRYP